jgi:hypothetical protein
MDWSQQEVQLIIADYFTMLELELESVKYSKSEHRVALMQFVKRSKGSIEFKHQNISAVLHRMGIPFIKGYKPRFNYQRELLESEVAKFLQLNKARLEKVFSRFTDQEIITHPDHQITYEDVLDTEPVVSIANEIEPKYRPIKTNYLEREQNNSLLGAEGEKFVLEFEKMRLISQKQAHFIDELRWISRDEGDGTGYDILSKNENGSDRFIEVKTTKLSKETPIFLTSNERAFASAKGDDFFLYRVFNFGKRPKIFIKQGSYEKFCIIQPTQFRGYFQ